MTYESDQEVNPYSNQMKFNLPDSHENTLSYELNFNSGHEKQKKSKSIHPKLINIDSFKSKSSRNLKNTRNVNDSTKDVHRLSNLIVKGSDSNIKIESFRKDIQFRNVINRTIKNSSKIPSIKIENFNQTIIGQN